MADRRHSGWNLEGPELFGLVLVVIGGLWLASSTGLLGAFDFWGVLWPVVLIVAGVAVVTQGFRRQYGDDHVTVARDGASSLELRMTFGGGRLRLRGGGPALVEAHSGRDDIEADVRRAGDRARVRLDFHGPWGYARGPAEWEVASAADVPTDLRVSAGAGDIDLDLSGLRVARAELRIGAASARVVLPPPTGDVPVSISAGAAHLTVEIPAGVEARVTTAGLVSVTGRTETPGYAAARDRVTVSASGGAAQLTIR